MSEPATENELKMSEDARTVLIAPRNEEMISKTPNLSGKKGKKASRNMKKLTIVTEKDLV